MDIKRGEEIFIPMPWGHIAGKEWGTPGGPPILAYHGMQENCCSFDFLAPLLPSKYHLLALDFPGYGQSPAYPLNTYATCLGYVVELLRIVRHFGWKKVTLLGHSYGGAMVTYMAATCPDLISRVITLEAAKPLSYDSSKATEIARARAEAMLTLSDKYLAKKKTNRQLLHTLDEALRMMMSRNNNSLTERSARQMLPRNVTVVDAEKDLVAFNLDYQNLLMMQPYYSEVETQSFARSLAEKCDTLFITAEDGEIASWAVENDVSSVKEFRDTVMKGGRATHVHVPGTHHVHVNHPERVASFIVEFLENSRIDPHSTAHQQPFSIFCHSNLPRSSV